jgi:hypothetical protein
MNLNAPQPQALRALAFRNSHERKNCCRQDVLEVSEVDADLE